MNNFTTNPVQDVIGIVGSQSALAKACGVTQQSVWGWLKNGKVPPSRVLFVEKLVKRKVSRTRLNPDIYPREKN